jgi:hypothetical protein
VDQLCRNAAHHGVLKILNNIDSFREESKFNDLRDEDRFARGKGLKRLENPDKDII